MLPFLLVSSVLLLSRQGLAWRGDRRGLRKFDGGWISLSSEDRELLVSQGNVPSFKTYDGAWDCNATRSDPKKRRSPLLGIKDRTPDPLEFLVFIHIPKNAGRSVESARKEWRPFIQWPTKVKNETHPDLVLRTVIDILRKRRFRFRGEAAFDAGLGPEVAEQLKDAAKRRIDMMAVMPSLETVMWAYELGETAAPFSLSPSPLTARPRYTHM